VQCPRWPWHGAHDGRPGPVAAGVAWLSSYVRLALSSLPLLLIATLTVGYVAFAATRLALTLHAVALGASHLQIGLLLGLIMAVPMLLAVHIGRWSDRQGYARVAAQGLALQAAGSVLLVLWPSLPALFVASVCTGTGYMTAHVAVNNAIGRAAPAGRMTDAFSAMAMGFAVAGLSGPTLAGLAIDHAGYRWVYALPCMLALLSMVVLRAAARRHPLAAGTSDVAPRRRAVDLLREAPLRRVLVLSGLVAMGWDLFTFLAPLQGVRAALSATATGAVVGMFGAGAFAIRLLLPLLARRLGEWHLLRGALLLTAAGYLAFPLLHSVAALSVAAFLLGMALGCGQPVSMALIHRHAPSDRAGEAVGLRSVVTSASQAMLPLVSGALGSALGLGVVFWITSALLAVGVVTHRR
jgi:MFS family permease